MIAGNNHVTILSVLILLFTGLKTDADKCVILLHGLGRTSASMKPIEHRLKEEGYTVYSIEYPSTRYSIAELCTLYVEKELRTFLPACDTVCFVSHSMGGIIVRYLLTKKMFPCFRTVMLCPPNQGSSLTDSLKKYIGWLYRKINGPAGTQLGNDSLSIIPELPTFDGCALGIIAGDKSWEPYFSRLIPGRDDGKVSIEETKLAGMDDFIILNHTHTFMMNNRDTQDQIVHFLKYGRFKRLE